MDWNDTADQAAFRAEVRALIDEELPERYRDGRGDWQNDRVSDDPQVRETAQGWVDALSEKGWVAPHWPQEYGGAGLSSMEQFIFNQEMSEARAPRTGGRGVGLLGPALIVHGTEEQKREHLPRILSGEVAWAQGYSEPGAGSDLASLQTRAARDGDEYVLNGQKIWTSEVHTADWLFALVRTDPDAPKHRGISFLMMDVKSPGISIRPLVDMTDEHWFNETFFEDVRVPVANLVGEENRGWYVGMTLLDYERSNVGGAVMQRRAINELIDYANGDGAQVSRLGELPALRTEVADRYIETEVMFNFSFRIISMQNAGQLPNYEASMSKLFNSELSQWAANTSAKVIGLYANLYDRDEERAPMQARYSRGYVGASPATIRGGTSEVMRNIIATRGLGLPRG
jgi:alkylation response protein AidB-like acyl-CoA dehydrogenase